MQTNCILSAPIFSERDTYVHVRYMLSAVRLSSVCLSSVMLVHPTQPVEVFGNFFHHTLAQGPSFLMPKFVGGGRPFPLKFLFKVTDPLLNSKISINIGS